MTTSMQHRLSLSLYLNYIVHGIGLIIIAQNMQALSQSFGSPVATVALVLSGVGLGRFPAYFAFGVLADKMGRKACIYIGMALYLVFFAGMMLTHNLQVAYGLAMCAGAANSAFDAGSYPTFADLGGKAKASNVLIKAAMSIGEFILPIFVAYNENMHGWYGWSFAIGVVLLVINAALLVPIQFPAINAGIADATHQQLTLSMPRKVLATIALALYGYTSMGLMIWFTQWISLYATKVLGFSNLNAHLLLSSYSVGSITGVLVIFALLRKQVPEGWLLVALNACGALALAAVCLVHTPLIGMIAAFVFGLSAAGGGMQVGLTMFLSMYPNIKGLITGIFMNFGSLATFSVPLITGWLSAHVNLATALRADLLVAVAGLALVFVARSAMHEAQTTQQEAMA
ncbi:MFS transporter [Lacticaseibacillus jixiensis]|uniref:MFS transporter n=1 Tax=Lacticaseibacillus jixiensis TaxID=3231926 RepID=UPI0036F3BA1D